MLQFFGSIILLLGMLQFFLAINVGAGRVAILHLGLAITGGVLMFLGFIIKKRKKV